MAQRPKDQNEMYRLRGRRFKKSPFVKQAVEEALDDLKHKRYVTLKDYVRGKRSS